MAAGDEPVDLRLDTFGIKSELLYLGTCCGGGLGFCCVVNCFLRYAISPYMDPEM